MKTETLIGRKTEIAEIQNCIKSDRSEFVILYGRRRIGKTFLVKKYFDGNFDFHFVGASRHTTPQQLEDFGKSLAKYADTAIQTPRNWSDALDMLARHLESINKKRKKIIFIDEMPWIDRKQSDFVAALVIITLGTVHKTIPAHVWLIDGFIKQETSQTIKLL